MKSTKEKPTSPGDSWIFSELQKKCTALYFQYSEHYYLQVNVNLFSSSSYNFIWYNETTYENNSSRKFQE